VAPEQAVGGGQAVRIMVGQLGLTYLGVTMVMWHWEGGTSTFRAFNHWGWCLKT